MPASLFSLKMSPLTVAGPLFQRHNMHDKFVRMPGGPLMALQAFAMNTRIVFGAECVPEPLREGPLRPSMATLTRVKRLQTATVELILVGMPDGTRSTEHWTVAGHRLSSWKTFDRNANKAYLIANSEPRHIRVAVEVRQNVYPLVYHRV